MLHRRARAVAAAALLACTVLACGENTRDVANPKTALREDDPKVEPTVFPSKSPSPVPSSAAPSASGSASSAPVQSGPPAGGGTTVEATAANTFVPATLTVKTGTKVTWTNPGGGFHTVTGGTPGAKDAATINSPQPFTTYELTFAKPGTYKYFCEPHASLNMVGEIVVT